jgi:NADH-quinone oxidoreductase subunit L
MSTQTAPWIILFTPLVSAALILLLGKFSKTLSASLALIAAGTGCALSWWLFNQPVDGKTLSLNWLTLGPELNLAIGVTLDHLSKVMLLVVTSISVLVFTYSLGYMRDEEGYSRFFAGLSLFLFSMLGIVLADNFVMMFIFWELVGVSSYILIGHYYSKDSAADAGKQAFIVNRIGDFGFLLGILLLWFGTGTVVFTELFEAIPGLATAPIYLTVACVLVFMGTIGKSAQMPLHVWLPNSMEGPTPVSSLLHAATMVAAGVYMLARIFPILEIVPPAREIIAWIGGITCFAAALMATQQSDIKRILAYSTISQLGYMVLGIGVAPTSDVAMFHLFTHACFKCLLFLAAGSVMIAMHHEVNMWHMGGLRKKTPVTMICFFLGMLALAGCPYTSGYFSKDLIIEWAVVKIPFLGWLVAAAAGLTAFYIFREFFVVFFGKARSEHAEHAKEQPITMLVPMLVLSVLAIFAGFPFIQDHFFNLARPDHELVPHLLHPLLYAMFFGGAGLSALLYFKAQKDPISIPLFANRLYIDNVYFWFVNNIQGGGAAFLSWADRWIVDLLVVQVPSKLTWACGFALRFLQLGNIQAYAFFFGAGVVGLLYILISK